MNKTSSSKSARVQTQPRVEPAKPDPADPFAEWEKANARTAPVEAAVEERKTPVVQQRSALATAEKTAAEKPAASFDEFDLDSILNEFK